MNKSNTFKTGAGLIPLQLQQEWREEGLMGVWYSKTAAQEL